MTRFDIFVSAQDAVWPAVTRELAAGTKLGHWMWFVFPQIAGLSSSEIATRFALGSVGEARAYLDHWVLGDRLRAVTRLVLIHAGREAAAIFGPLDAIKFRSSMTLFQVADPPEPLFGEALRAFFHGAPDAKTLGLLKDAAVR